MHRPSTGLRTNAIIRNIGIFVIVKNMKQNDIIQKTEEYVREALGGDEPGVPQKTVNWLTAMNIDKNIASHVCRIIEEISFKGAGVSDDMSTIEGEIVQDADRLDALGAIGIARCFATGTKLGNIIYDPEILSAIHKTAEEYKKLRSTSINHFYEKLFLLKNRMKTNAGKCLAEERHKYMERFINQFLREWDGKS